MEVSSQLHDPAALSPGRESLVPLDRRLGEPQSRFGHGGEEKHSQPLPGLEPPDHPARNPAIPLYEKSKYLLESRSHAKTEDLFCK
jgi:hypothetical protein